MRVSVTIKAMTDAGVQCVVDAVTHDPFWLPRASKSCRWGGNVAVGEIVDVEIEDWLARKHKQLVAITAGVASPLDAPPPNPVMTEEGTMPDGRYQQKADSGNLFRVDERKSEKHPEYEGEYVVQCPHCGAQSRGWVKAWIKEAKTGRKFFSLAFKARQKQDA